MILKTGLKKAGMIDSSHIIGASQKPNCKHIPTIPCPLVVSPYLLDSVAYDICVMFPVYMFVSYANRMSGWGLGADVDEGLGVVTSRVGWMTSTGYGMSKPDDVGSGFGVRRWCGCGIGCPSYGRSVTLRASRFKAMLLLEG